MLKYVFYSWLNSCWMIIYDLIRVDLKVLLKVYDFLLIVLSSVKDE